MSTPGELSVGARATGIVPALFADQQLPDDATVTPGVEGFLVFFVLAIIVVLLVLSMSKHLRRVDMRAAEEADEAEEAERRAAEAVDRDESDESEDDGASSSGEALTDISPDPGDAGRQER